VILEFADGATASLTMTAFAPASDRKIRLFGTRGYIETDSVQIHHFDFVTEKTTIVGPRVEDGAGKAVGDHNGADFAIMSAFVEAVAAGDQRKVWSGPDETLASHRIVFAAEQARREGRVVEVCDPSC
jgi:predicted dehydrogenase